MCGENDRIHSEFRLVLEDRGTQTENMSKQEMTPSIEQQALGTTKPRRK